jgi:hypothetical protein
MTVPPADEAELDNIADVAWGPDWRSSAPPPRDSQVVDSGTPLLERIGPSYRVRAGALALTFREVRTDRELAADVAIAYGGRHLFRTTATLSLTTRDKLAKTVADLAGVRESQAREDIRRAVFAAVEAVLEAEEQIGAPVDLRIASLTLPAGGLHVAKPLWPAGSVSLNAPGAAGKSSMARAVSVSLASGRVVIPGIEPIGKPRPVLYVAAEDPVVHWHSRSVEAICRGIGIERSALVHPIELFDARGRPLHRIARALAERAADFGAVFLDSQQALLAQVDGNAGIRDRDSLFWHAIDQLPCPTFIIGHPNRSDSRDWQRADGRVAGSEVNRDRARMMWRMTWKDEPAIVGTSFRRYTLVNVKNNHGATEDPLGFSTTWRQGTLDDPGVVTFTATEPDATAMPDGLSPSMRETMRAYQDGATTPAELRDVLGVTEEAAKKRLQRLRAQLGDRMEGEA